MMGLIALIEFLQPLNIRKERDAWLKDSDIGFARITEFSAKKGTIKGLEHNPTDNTVEEAEYSFDDYLLKQLNKHIAEAIKVINDLELNPKNAETVMSNKLFNSTISRIKNKLTKRYNQLSDISFNIPQTLEKLDIFIHKQLRNQEIRPEKPHKLKVLEIATLKLTAENIEQKLLRPLFHWLVLKGTMNKDCENAFLSFLKGKWDLKNAIEWNGKPEELMAFHYAVYNKIDSLGEPILSPKPISVKLLSAFILVVDNKRLDSHSFRKYNSNPKQGQFYKKLVSKILELTQ